MYADFLDAIEEILNLSIGCRPVRIKNYDVRFKFVETNFPQHFNYERTKELIFFHIECAPVIE